jgi:hypothetical protein
MYTYIHTYIQTYTYAEEESDSTSERRQSYQTGTDTPRAYTTHTHTHTHTHTQIFNERATPELSDWDRYAKIEYQRLAMEEDQGEFGDDVDWDAQVN